VSGDPGSKSEHFRQELLAGLERFLTLFGRILLRLGVGYGEFTVIARRAFAAGGARSLGLESPADDPERVAALTGLTTEDIAAAMIVDKKPGDDHSLFSPLSTILHFWHHDQDYTDLDKKPRELPIEGEAPSFDALARRVGGGAATEQLLTDLEEWGCVERTEDGRLRVLTDCFTISQPGRHFAHVVTRSMTDLSRTLLHNMEQPDKDQRWMQRFVWTDRLLARDVSQFRELAVRQGRYSTDMLDEWLAGHEADTDYPHGNMLHRAGVGVYYFEVENDGDGD
jgi:hypothetical protein